MIIWKQITLKMHMFIGLETIAYKNKRKKRFCLPFDCHWIKSAEGNNFGCSKSVRTRWNSLQTECKLRLSQARGTNSRNYSLTKDLRCEKGEQLVAIANDRKARRGMGGTLSGNVSCIFLKTLEKYYFDRCICGSSAKVIMIYDDLRVLNYVTWVQSVDLSIFGNFKIVLFWCLKQTIHIETSLND